MISLKKLAPVIFAALFLLPFQARAADIVVNNESELRSALSSAASGDRVILNDSGTVPTNITLSSAINGTASGFILDGGTVIGQLGTIIGDNTFYLINMGTLAIDSIRNIEINNGTSAAAGLAGAFSVGNITGSIANAAFRRNVSNSANGGALFVNGNFTGSFNGETHFNTNRAQIGSGGGMAVNGSFLGRLEGAGGGKDVHFDFNTAGAHGGGLYVRDSFGSSASPSRIFAAHFSSNTAQGSGGGLYVGQSFIANLGDYAFFDKNTAQGSGGGMHVERDLTGNMGSIVMFTENSAGPNGGNDVSASSSGGGLYVGGAISGNIWLNTYVSNKAGGSGGGIYADRLTGNFGNGNVFTSNTAQGSGGGIYLRGSQGAGSAGFSGIMNDSTFTSNRAVSGSGGAIAIDGNADWAGSGTQANGNGSIYHMNFSQNEAGGSGGAIYVSGAMRNIDLHLGTFENNRAISGSGGAISSGPISGPIRTSTFTGNSAGTSGGAINSTGTLTGNLDGNTFRANSAGGSGGAVNLGGDLQGNLLNNNFRDNIAGGSGGGLNLGGALQGMIRQGNFNGNKANGGDGGAINAASMTGDILGPTYFTNNSASGSGGAINLSGALQGNIDYSFFWTNQAAGGSGGGINASSIRGNISGGSAFIGNSASTSGGGINAGSISGDITLGTFSTNTAGSSGGAINTGSLSGSIATSSFTSNSAGTDGGAIKSTVLSSSIRASSFSSNKATGSGGGIHAGSLSGSMSSTSFTSNTAGADGGAIHAAAFSGSIQAGSFTNNSAGARGGAIYGLPSLMDGTIFSGNSAADGGAIYGVGSGGQIRTATFSENKATGSGGAIALTPGLPLTIQTTQFYSNTAGTDGGAIYGLPSLIDNSAFLGNGAANGGALYGTSGGSMQVRNSIFNSNTATADGGAMYFSQGVPITLHNTQLFSNSAGGLGGGIYFNTTAGTSYDFVLSADADNSTLFTGNTSASGRNSFHVGGTAAGGSFNLSTAGAGSLELLDPFSAAIGASSFNLTHNAPEAMLIMSGVNDLSTNGGSVGLNFLSGVTRVSSRFTGTDFTLKVNGTTDSSMTWGRNNILTIDLMEERNPNLALIDFTGSTGRKDFVIEEGATLDITRVMNPLPNQRYLLVDGLNPASSGIPDNVRVSAIRLLSPEGYTMLPLFEQNGTQLWLANLIIPDPFDENIAPPNLVDAENCVTRWLNHTANGLALSPYEVLALRRDFDSGPPEAAVDMALVGADIHETVARAAKGGFLDRGAPSVFQGDIRFWTRYLGALNKTLNHRGYSGYESSTNGVLLGASWEPSPEFSLGGYAGYSHSDTDFRTISADAESEGVHAGVQASYLTPWGLRLTADGSYSRQKVDLDRYPGDLGHDRGRFAQELLGAGLEVSYDIELAEHTRLAPAASLASTWLWQESFTEQGEIMAAHVGSIEENRLSATLGATLEYDLLFEEGSITPGIGVHWKHQLSGRQPEVRYAFVDNGSCDYTCTARSRRMGANALELSAYVDGTIRTESAEWSIQGGYRLESGDNAIGHMFYGEIAVRF